MHRLLPLLAILLFSCGPTTRPDFVVHMVDGNGGSPFLSACTTGSIVVNVAQGTEAVITTNGAVAGGVPTALSVQIPGYGQLTQIQVIVTCTAGTAPMLIGSTPQFVPVGYTYVNVVLGPPNECVSLSTPTLVPPVAGPSLMRLGANVVVLGGLSASGAPNVNLQNLDTVTLTHLAQPLPFDPLLVGPGLARAVRLDSTRILFFGDGIAGVYDAGQQAQSASTAFTSISLHAGAGSESALVDLLDGSFAIVGGGTAGGDAVAGITWVRLTDTGTVDLTMGTLSFARRRPAAAFIQNKLIIAGGQGPLEPLFEIIAVHNTSDPAIPFATTADTERYGAVLTTDALHARAFLALGSTHADDDTVLLTTTFELTSCTTTGPTPGCAITAGPTVTDPRAHVAVVEHQVGGTTATVADYETLLIGGIDTTGAFSPLIDRIHFDTTSSHFTIASAGMLNASRDRPGATEIGGGVVMAGGGADERGNPLGTLELCFPPFLAPITSI